MRKVILFSLTLSSLILSAQSYAEGAVSCRPNYQPDYEACKPTGHYTGQKAMVEKTTPVTGACEPNVNEICVAHKPDLLQKYPDLRLQDVEIITSQEAAVGKYCNPKGIEIYTKQDVKCEYRFVANVPELKPDPSCPVIGASDANNCFSNKVVSIDNQSVKDCLDMRPQTRGEIWMQSVCLSDIYNAQNNSQLATDLPKDLYERIQVRLESIRNRAKTPDDVRQFLSQQQAK